MTEVLVHIESIRINGRHRADLGDIDSLAKSIADISLLNPITITSDNVLVAGERRLAALRRLGWTEAPARVVDNLADAAAKLRAERDENICRKEMTVSELMALADALEEIEKPKAAARQAQAPGQPRGMKATHAVVCPDQVDRTDAEPNGSTRDIVAQALGMSSGSYSRARAVHKAANDVDAEPELREAARQALADADSGAVTISGAYEQFRQRREELKPRANTIIRAAAQRKAISAAAITLSGVCHGLKQVTDLHPDITDEEVAQWVDDLSESRRVIESLIKRLRERQTERNRT